MNATTFRPGDIVFCVRHRSIHRLIAPADGSYWRAQCSRPSVVASFISVKPETTIKLTAIQASLMGGR